MILPLLYHTHHSRSMEDLPFWLQLAGEQGGPLLELGCGTGRILVPLLQAGYQAYGLDHDEGMLSFLRSSLPPERRSQPPVFRADMARFCLAARFALILMPCNTLSTLDPETRLSALRRVHEHLAPGGKFAASLPNPDLMRSLPRRSEAEVEDLFQHPLSGEPLQVSSAWQRTSTHLVVTWYYDELLPDGRVHRLEAQTRHFLSPASVYFRELEQAGLKLEATYGDFDRSPYDSRSPSLILIASLPRFRI